MRIVQKALGVLLAALGLGATVFTLLALADPQGAQLANDADPFGVPSSTAEALTRLAGGLVALIVGLWLILRRKAQ